MAWSRYSEPRVHPQNRSRTAVLVAALLLATICGYFTLRDPATGTLDFQAFYCGGSALRDRADPYRTHPLIDCEHRQTNGTAAQLGPGVVLPAPQPPYDLAAFALFSYLPFQIAKGVWGSLIALGLVATLFSTAQFTRAPIGTVVAAFLMSLVMPSLGFGQLFALFSAAACAAALCAAREQWLLAGVAASASLIEPHLGLPLCISLALWNRRCMLSIAASVFVLAILSLVTAGPQQTIEYITVILPLHGLAEITSDWQLSLSAILYGAHVPAKEALQAGTASYVLLAAVGIALGRTLTARLRDGSFIVLVPMAFTVIGGSFIHVTEIFAAVPLALMLLARASQHYKGVLLTALILLAVPWMTALYPGNPLAFAIVDALVVFYLLWENVGNKIGAAAIPALVTYFLLRTAQRLMYSSSAASAHPVVHDRIDATYAQAGWQMWNQSALSSGAAITWLLRAPSWIGLCLLAGSCVLLAGTSVLVRQETPQQLPVNEYRKADDD